MTLQELLKTAVIAKLDESTNNSKDSPTSIGGEINCK